MGHTEGVRRQKQEECMMRFITRSVQAMSRKDYGEVMQLSRQAVRDGLAIGYAYQGMMYLHGLGVRKNSMRARELFQTGAVKGDPASAMEYVKLAIRQSSGESSECFLFLDMAARARIPEAEYLLALYLWDGRICPKEEEQAFVWMERAAEDGIEDALAYVGLFHVLGIGTGKDRAKGKELLIRAMAAGSRCAAEMLEDHFPDDEERSSQGVLHA